MPASTASLAKDAPRIAILDSGVGGLSIAVPYSQLFPHTIDYLADTGYYPYGTKPQPALVRRVVAVVAAYLRQHADCQQLIVACNSASTLCLDALRETFTLPIIGVVPALKPACEQSDRPSVGLLATLGTIKRPYVEDLMQQFGGGKSLIKVGSQSLVALAEQILHLPARDGDTAAKAALVREISLELEPFREAIRTGALDTIVLGCTHFPWVKAALESLLPDDQPLYLLDSTEAIIRRSCDLLGLAAPKSLSASLSLPTLDSPPIISGCYYDTEAIAPPNSPARLFEDQQHLAVD